VPKVPTTRFQDQECTCIRCPWRRHPSY